MKEKNQKLVIRSTGNDGQRYHYEFEKNDAFVDSFIEFMSLLGFDKDKIESYFYPYNEKLGNHFKITWKEVHEEVWNFKDRDFDIDIFFKSKRIEVLVRIIKPSSFKRLKSALDKCTIFIE